MGHYVGGGGGRRQGVEQRRAERAPDLLRGVDERAGHAGVPIADPYEGGTAEGREGQAQADTHQDLLRSDVHPEIAVHPDLGQPGQAAGGDGEADRHRDPRTDPRAPGRTTTRRHNDAEREGQEGEPRFERRVVQHALQVVAQEDEHGEEPRAGEQRGQERTAPVAVAHHPERQERMAGLRLHEDERGEEDDGDEQQDDGHGGAPAIALRLGEAVDEADQTQRGEQRAGHVVLRGARGPALVHNDDRPDGGEDGDRHVDEQAPPPRGVLRQHAAEQDADGSSGTRDGAVGPEGLGPLLGVVLEGDGQDGQGGGRHECCEPALQGAGGEEHRFVDGQAAEGRRAGEAQQPDDEDPLAAREVGDPATEQQEAAEGEGVRGDHPLAVGRRDAEGVLRRRQRNGDDRCVEDDHQLRHDDDGEDAPAPRVGSGPSVRSADDAVTMSLDSTVSHFRSPCTQGQLRGRLGVTANLAGAALHPNPAP